MKQRSQRHGAKRAWIFLLALAACFAAAFFIYVSIYYRADETARAFMRSDEAVSVTETEYGWLFDGPSEDAALVFYPGGKVEEIAYAPLLHALAAQGMDACLLRMPLRLAIFDGDAAGRAMKAHDYAKWYVSGHSLGGVMAAGYAATHGEELSGVALLAAYPTRKLPEGMAELLIVGTEDGVLNEGRIASSRRYAPEKYVEISIEGGNHAQFGSYGAQRGDGTATISPEEQRRLTVEAIVEHLSPAYAH